MTTNSTTSIETLNYFFNYLTKTLSEQEKRLTELTNEENPCDKHVKKVLSAFNIRKRLLREIENIQKEILAFKKLNNSETQENETEIKLEDFTNLIEKNTTLFNKSPNFEKLLNEQEKNFIKEKLKNKIKELNLKKLENETNISQNERKIAV